MAAGERRTAVILSRANDRAAQWLARVLKAGGWRPVVESAPERFAWTVRVTRAQAALLVAAEAQWTLDQVRELRAVVQTPLVVVGRYGSTWVAMALRTGADQVVPASVSDDELSATVDAVARRIDGRLGEAADRMLAGPLEVDLTTCSVRLDGRVLDLTRTEFRLLVALMRQHGRAVATQSLTRQVWEIGAEEGANALRICVRRLRVKLRDPATAPHFIVAVRGFGYRFQPSVVQVSHEAGARGATARLAGIDLLAALAEELADCRTPAELAHHLAETLTRRQLCDAVAVHAVGRSGLRLQAQRGHSTSWEARCAEIPLRTGYASVRAFNDGQELQVLPSTAARYRDTLELCRLEEISAIHFLPFRGAGVRGCVGLSRRSTTAWTEEGLAVTRAAASLYASQLSARGAAAELVAD